jgi:hypothetical protein
LGKDRFGLKVERIMQVHQRDPCDCIDKDDLHESFLWFSVEVMVMLRGKIRYPRVNFAFRDQSFQRF